MSKSYYRQIALAPLGPEAIEQLLARPARLGPVARRAARTSSASAPRATRSSSRRSCSRWSRPATSRASAAPTGSSRPVDGRGGAGERAGGPRRRASTGSPSARRRVLQAAAVIGKEFSGPVLARVADARAGGARGRASRPGGGRVRLRAGALSGGDLRVQAPADPGGGLRLAARRAPRRRPRRGRPGDRRAAPRAARRARRAAGPALGERGRATRGGALARARRRLGRNHRPDRGAAALAQGARAGRRAARLRGDGRARAHGADLRAQLRLAAGPLRRGGRGALHRSRADGHGGTGHVVADAPAHLLRQPADGLTRGAVPRVALARPSGRSPWPRNPASPPCA